MLPPVEATAIAITFANGSLGIMRFVTNDYRGIQREATSEAIAAEIAKSAFDSPPVSWRLIANEAEIPADRRFRNAWRDTAGKLAVAMPLAREIHREYLRALRAPKLAALDTEYMRADEAGDAAAKARIAAQKQALRDVTADPAIEAAKTPEALAAVLPAALRGAP